MAKTGATSVVASGGAEKTSYDGLIGCFGAGGDGATKKSKAEHQGSAGALEAGSNRLKHGDDPIVRAKLSQALCMIGNMSAGPTTTPPAKTTNRKTTNGKTRSGRHLQLVFSAPPEATTDVAPVTWSGSAVGGRSSLSGSLTASLSPSARRLRRSVLAAGLAKGIPVDATAVTVILAAKMSCHTVPAHLFTEDMVWQLVWIDVFTWCATRRIPVPEGLAEALWDILNHLESTNGFHSDSDAVELLRGPLMSSAGLAADGSARHPTDRQNA